MDEPLDYYLDVLGQQPLLLKLYTQICFCYAVPDPFLHSKVIDTLITGLERLSASFPWVAGQVVKEDRVFRIKPFERIPRLVVKDLGDDPSIPTIDDFRNSNFPMSMLDENIIAPRNTLPDGQPTAPVFLVQANFITGGLLLTIVAQHNVMDMTGQSQIMDLLSKACHNEPFTSEEVSNGNLNRRNLFPLLDNSWQPGPELDRQIIKPPPESKDNTPPPKCTWTYFAFSATSLSALKSFASKTLSSGYISTDDALSAFIWQSVLRARLPRLDPTASSTFARAVDPRRYLGIPSEYPGVVQNMAYNTCTLEELLSLPLGAIASSLRSTVDPKTSDLAYRTRALATFISRHANETVASVTASIDLSTDIMLSSWAKYDCYELDFNLGLGKPVAVRRPRFTPCESLMYLMPRSTEGDIALAACLREGDLERLRGDGEWMRYARYVG
jgi:hypothetical protein